MWTQTTTWEKLPSKESLTLNETSDGSLFDGFSPAKNFDSSKGFIEFKKFMLGHESNHTKKYGEIIKDTNTGKSPTGDYWNK